MAEWPTLTELKQSLGVTQSAQDSLLSSALAASVEQVAVDLGYTGITVTVTAGVPELLAIAPWSEESDPEPEEVVPSHKLSHAALILAVMVVKAPAQPYGIVAAFDAGAVKVAAEHPTYTVMLTGERLAFGFG